MVLVMKIGIMSMQRVINYGSYMQALGLKHTIFVTSNFLLNNKIYDKFYYCSIILIVVLWLLSIFLFKVI